LRLIGGAAGVEPDAILAEYLYRVTQIVWAVPVEVRARFAVRAENPVAIVQARGIGNVLAH
jgi:hypothetical protein